MRIFTLDSSSEPDEAPTTSSSKQDTMLVLAMAVEGWGVQSAYAVGLRWACQDAGGGGGNVGDTQRAGSSFIYQVPTSTCALLSPGHCVGRPSSVVESYTDAGEILGRAVRMWKGASSDIGVQRRLPTRAIFEKSPEPFQVEGTECVQAWKWEARRRI